MASRDEYASSGQPSSRNRTSQTPQNPSSRRRPPSGTLPPGDDPQRPTERSRRASGQRIPTQDYRDGGSSLPRTRPVPSQLNDSNTEKSGKARPRLQPEITVRSVASANTPLPPPHGDQDPMIEAGKSARNMAGSAQVSRKKSMVRPERRRLDPDDPDYYYRKHAQKMNVMPSTTGVDPQLEEDAATLSSDETLHAGLAAERDTPLRKKSSRKPKASNKLRKTETDREADALEKRRQRIKEASSPPTLWGLYCHLITFFIPNIFLKWCGKRAREQQRAWREKIGLISLIALTMLFVGFLTFGFTETVCPAGGPLRLRVNKVGPGYMIFHGEAYDLTRSRHPLARGVPSGANVLWDGSMPGAGKDGSFLFQNVNGHCKGLITAAPDSDVVTDSSGNLAWYFPCNLYNQDGSSSPNETIPYYLGYACHTSKAARLDFYDLRSSGDVFFTWDDVKNSSRNLMVYSGDVLDLDLLEWFNKTQVSYPPLFDSIRLDPAVRGKDVTISLSSGEAKQVAQCFQEIIKVGTIDTETVGCIASKVVLYVSLIFILSIVVTKFILAIVFQWFLSKKFAAGRTSMTGDKKKRNRQIEDWTEDIYRPPPKITDPGSIGGSDRPIKRSSFLPTTSRFTSPYTIERNMRRTRLPPQTMVSQSQSSTRLLSASYSGMGQSDNALPGYGDVRHSMVEGGRSSYIGSANPSDPYSSAFNPETEISGPQGFIHESVVPQPPPEWQPFGFPLAHTICLVTAYSEGLDGIRTTLDSIAMTDYPNSHKVLYVVCDGLIKGKGESMSTPDACLSMMRDFAVVPEEVRAYSYVAVASGSKRHNMAKVYCGFYDYGAESIIPVEKQQRVPMVLVVKCGTPAEANTAKPGNRGKRDSQIVLMSFLQKVMFDERMTELEYEMFNGIWKLTGISPDFYECVLMVDADTKVFPDSMTHLVSAMVKDPEIMGLCGETKIANKGQSWVTMIQVFEYFISHHMIKSFESVFGGVTCLPGCFCMYRIKAPKGGQNYWVPILANPDIVEHYSENVVDTLHKKNLLLLGEDRYLTSLMLKTFPKRKQMFIPQSVCKTTVPDTFKVLLSQRRRWINSTVHNLMELILVRDLCGTFCFSMQFVLFIDLIGTLVLPAAIAFTIYVVSLGIKAAITHTAAPVIPLVLLALILGLPGMLIVITAQRISYVGWMFVYLMSLPIWNFVLPMYAFWHFDDFSWGDTRQAAGDIKGGDKTGHGGDGEFDSSQITMKRWGDFEQERRLRQPQWNSYVSPDRPYSGYGGKGSPSTIMTAEVRGHERKPSNLVL